MSVKYSRLPTTDSLDRDTVAFDFPSYYTYTNGDYGQYNENKYKSIFQYGDKSQMSGSDIKLSTGKLLYKHI